LSGFDSQELFIRVKDSSCEEFLCLLKALKNPKDLSPEELEHCVDSATVGRYAGDIKIVNKK
jgi:hypothetical protein